MSNLGKKKPQVKDPVRYPKVIEPYEEKAYKEGKEVIGKMLVDLTKVMVKEIKNK